MEYLQLNQGALNPLTRAPNPPTGVPVPWTGAAIPSTGGLVLQTGGLHNRLPESNPPIHYTQDMLNARFESENVSGLPLKMNGELRS